MRLSRAAGVVRKKDQKLTNSRTKKKHKRLDAICEKAYNESRQGVKNLESSEVNEELELRRSSRVRRAPIMLDASPPPPKKRRRVGKIEGGVGVRVKSEPSTPCSSSRDIEVESGGWRTRLRSRERSTGFREREKGVVSSPRGKRKLFDGFKEELEVAIGDIDVDMNEVGRKSMVVKSKRPERVKASNVLRKEVENIEFGGGKEDDEKETKGDEALDEKNGVEIPVVEGEEKESGQAGGEKGVKVPLDLAGEGETKGQDDVQSEGCQNDKSVDMDPLDVQLDDGGEEQQKEEEFGGVNGDQAIDGNSHGKHLDQAIDKLNKTCDTLIARVGKIRIKEGRRCGLCGGGTDGKPPKKLVHDGTGSDNEAYSGSSASDEHNYDMWDGFGDEPGWLGRLLGPINDRFGIAGIWVHQQCAVWSPEVYFAGLGCLKNVRAALCRGRALKCSRCGRPGATIGCRVDRCPKTYHLPCARANGCIFDHRKFLIACTYHRHLFQPQGSQYLNRIKKMKARKMKLEIRKMSNDAWRKDIEAEEKWLENCGEDEEFLKRESKRLHRDLSRIAPVYIGGSSSGSELQFEGWESVAGLQDVIQCMKEVVILPLLYPEFFSNLGLTPPRGILLHGHPGTGKTLVVRALIGSCARGDKRIAYFARKGADCLGKYVGDAERQLRLLFQVAEKSQPSIIFFDEIDGLAPSRTRQQDQTHSSVVSTLLALMDGLKSRGSVVVIGATNRPDAVDPALRRPGRFDREIYFPLPSVKDREAILSLHTRKWPKPLTGSLLKWIANKTIGYAGADLQALCTQAAIVALRRNFPLQKFLSEAGKETPYNERPPLPISSVEERDWLEALSCSAPPCSRREAGIAANDVVSSPLPAHFVPYLLQPLSTLLVSLHRVDNIWLPAPLLKAATLIEKTILSVLCKKNLQSNCWWSHVHDLLQEANFRSEVESNLLGVSTLIEDASYGCFDEMILKANGNLSFGFSKVQQFGARPGLLQSSSSSVQTSGFRMLISGNPRSGQRHLASSLLHCFVSSIQIQKVDLATISQGCGDMIQGLTRILMGSAGMGPCLVFMPRIDLWAVETFYHVDELGSEGDDEKKISPVSTDEKAETQNAVKRASYIWNIFVEQFESLCVSRSLIVMATSEVPDDRLPSRVKRFFNHDMSDCSSSTLLNDTVPRFSVRLDGSIDCEMVIDSFSEKLSNDLVQHFIQLIQRRDHVHATAFKEKNQKNVVDDVNAIKPCTDLGSAKEPTTMKSAPVTPVVGGNRTLKGKSSLLLAISTFGYQILRYPHFAELCWVTSKLKEGPSTDISGPWKGWPFNSCIVRPLNPEKVAVVSGLSNSRNKEKLGLVRGLIAVGLSAYRGEYTSLREVSFEVRKVLELLVGLINAKIQSRKDRYQFIRLLSQVAFLEDMVMSWAYTLQSLEVDTQTPEANSKLIAPGSLNDCALKDSNYQDDGCGQNASDKTLHTLQLLEENLQEINDKNIASVDLGEKTAVGSLNSPGEEAIVNHSKLVVSDLSAPSAQRPRAPQSEVNTESCMPEDIGNSAATSGSLPMPMNCSNGFTEKETVDVQVDGPRNPGDKCDDLCWKGCYQDTGLSFSENTAASEDGRDHSDGSKVDTSSSCKDSSSHVTDNALFCSYHCCNLCLVNLHHLLRDILRREWRDKAMDSRLDDLHDFLASESVTFHSAVRRLCLAVTSRHVFHQEMNKGKSEKSFDGQEPSICQCKLSQSRLDMPMECKCHSMSYNPTTSPNASLNPRHGHDPRFVFRDGVLASLDTNVGESFHCKFETLCLCSLIEWVGISKEP